MFTQHVLDALTVSMLYNPHLLEFWQVMMGMQKSTKNSMMSGMFDDIVQQGGIDILEIPANFSGNFGRLFEILLASFGTVAIALYR